MFVHGWSEVGTFFKIPGNNLILMTYVTKNTFLLDFLPQKFDPKTLPKWHSYKYSHLEPLSFEVKLTKYLAKGSQLVRNSLFHIKSKYSIFNHLTTT
jgi:hypothetical protein